MLELTVEIGVGESPENAAQDMIALAKQLDI
jgi:hypothetical protein